MATASKKRTKSEKKPLPSDFQGMDIPDRVVIESVSPEIDDGKFPAKKVVGEACCVEADVYTEGHDDVRVLLLYRKDSEKDWHEAEMTHVVNDRFRGEFTIKEMGDYVYSVVGWVDQFTTWKKGLQKKWEANQDVSSDLLGGAQYLDDQAAQASDDEAKAFKKWAKMLRHKKQDIAYEAASDDELAVLVRKYGQRHFQKQYHRELRVIGERKKALFSTWYEMFPRSWAGDPGKHGTFKDVERLLPDIARMGFDVLYFPPIHPIGKTKRKGKNNTVTSEKGDVGSPWAIGSKEGGHKAIHPQLGTLEDFRRLVKKAGEHGLDIALDIAFQCSPDHPYVKKHPQWFKHRPDGTIKYAENPPKKYEDIYPINFDTDDWQNLYTELKSIVTYWAEQGVRIFRVDNPHTKPLFFWDWLIGQVRAEYPDAIFLSEAFTRPKVMKRLAKGGFSQSYTYFTWRYNAYEMKQYLHELTKDEPKDYFRPNFWPNTPDILPEYLQHAGRPAFMMRLVLAATLSSNYGVYGPAFELCVNDGVPGKEEYDRSEKYEIKQWDWNQPWNLKDFITRVNHIRKTNEALQTTWNLEFCDIDNGAFLCYVKKTKDLSNIILVVVNMDPYHKQSGWLRVPIEQLGIATGQSYMAYDLLSADKYFWQNEYQFVQLIPQESPAHIFKIASRPKREQDFDYYV